MKNDFSSTKEKAEKIITTNDSGAIKMLLNELNGNNEQVCLLSAEVLYQVGIKAPELIANDVQIFTNRLKVNSLRLRLKCMDILLTIVQLQHKSIWLNLYEKSDYLVDDSKELLDKLASLLHILSSYSEYRKDCIYAILAILEVCSLDKVATYTEYLKIEFMEPNAQNMLKKTLLKHYDVVNSDQQKRIGNILGKLE